MEKQFNLSIKNFGNIPCGTMYCIGRNYSKHAKEMGAEVEEEPIVFLKSATALLTDGETFNIPEFSNNVHYEVELVIVISKDCYKIEKNNALDYILGAGIGIDFTLRDVQQKAKDKGLPWAVAKGFAQSAPISEIIPMESIDKNLNSLDISLEVNGEIKQKSNSSEMERTVEDLIYYLSKVFYLRRGDIIFTGTPEGVGKINPQDKLKAKLEDLTELQIKVN